MSTTHPGTTKVALTAIVLLSLPALAAAQRLTGPGNTAAVPAPVALDTAGLFLAKYSRVGEDVFIAGQPTERALRELRAQGVTVVINLRTPEEMTRAVPFDEAALVKELGMRYVYLPVRGTAEFPYTPATLKEFTEAVASTEARRCSIAPSRGAPATSGPPTSSTTERARWTRPWPTDAR